MRAVDATTPGPPPLPLPELIGCAPLGERIRRSCDVVLALARADLRARYGRGPLQGLKWLLDPFALVGVYLLLVALVLHRPGHAPGLSLACAVVPFQVVMMSVVNALTSVSARRSIVANMGFPRVLIPLASVATEAMALGGTVVLFVLMLAIYGIVPGSAVLWLPLIVALTLLVSAAAAYPASLVGMWAPELRSFAVSFVRALFFVAPGLVTLSQIRGTTHDLLKLNPLTGLFEAFRDCLLSGRSPAAWELLVPFAAAVLLLGLFVPLYARDERHFAKAVE